MATLSRKTFQFIYEKILKKFGDAHPGKVVKGEPATPQDKVFGFPKKNYLKGSIGWEMKSDWGTDDANHWSGRPFNGKILWALAKTKEHTVPGNPSMLTVDERHLDVYLYYIGFRQKDLFDKVGALADEMSMAGLQPLVNDLPERQTLPQEITPTDNYHKYHCLFSSSRKPVLRQFLVDFKDKGEAIFQRIVDGEGPFSEFSGKYYKEPHSLRIEVNGRRDGKVLALTILASDVRQEVLGKEFFLGICSRFNDDGVPVSQYVAFVKLETKNSNRSIQHTTELAHFLHQLTLIATDRIINDLDKFKELFKEHYPHFYPERKIWDYMKGVYECYSVSSTEKPQRLRRCLMRISDEGKVEYYNVGNLEFEGQLVCQNDTNCVSIQLYSIATRKRDLRFTFFVRVPGDKPNKMLKGVFAGRAQFNKSSLAGRLAICPCNIEYQRGTAGYVDINSTEVHNSLESYPNLLTFLKGLDEESLVIDSPLH